MNTTLSPAVVFRRRSGWEAADLGIFLWRKNWLPIILFMGIPSAMLICVYAVTLQLGPERITLIAAALIWWLKPLLDRFVLQVISIRFFEQGSSFLGLFRGLGKTLRTGLLGDLFWRRFSLYRSARMPLLVLERPNRKNYKRRKQLLTRNGLGFGLPLTLICLGMFLALNFGELIFLQSVFNNFSNSYQNFFDFIGGEKLLAALVWYINMLLIETLYVCMGFSLYINSRVETEGWDIELFFKICVEKTERAHHRKTTPLVSVVILLFLFAAKPAWTQQNTVERNTAGENTGEPNAAPEILAPASVSAEASETLERILGAPEFGVEKPSKKIQLKKHDVPEDREREIKRFSFPALKEMLGVMLRLVLGTALAAALGTGVYFAYRYRSRLFSTRDGGKSRVDGNVIPDDPRFLLQKAEELHRNGKEREAWALCFKTFAAVFRGRWFLDILPETTEYETMVLVREKTKKTGTAFWSDAPEHIKDFELFVRRWILFAYGGRKPAEGTFEEAVVSCKVLMESGADA